MKRIDSADIDHTASTDHRILRGGQANSPDNQHETLKNGLPLVSFHRGRQEGQSPEDGRDLAVAVVHLAVNGEASAVRALPRALPALEAARERDPADFPALEAQGYALGLVGRPGKGLAAFQEVLHKAPDRELALAGAALMAEAAEREEAARGYWRRAVRVNPWLPEYRRRLTLLLVKDGAWNEAQIQCEAWLRLDPFSTEARATRVRCLLATGAKADARAEFARIEALAPPNLEELRIRFGKKLR
jgi:tetratricopeptide (TPR) repeat protein